MVDFLLNVLAACRWAPFPTADRPNPPNKGYTIQEPGDKEASGTIRLAEIASQGDSHNHGTAIEHMGTSGHLKMAMTTSRSPFSLRREHVSPACRLPPEILMDILDISVKSNGHSALDMMHVCHYWRAIAFDLPRLWSALTIRPWTAREYIEFVVERSKQTPLEVEINWNKGLGDDRRTHEGMHLALQTMSRWRTLTLAGFPAQLDINMVTEWGIPVVALAVPQIQALKITSDCEMSDPLALLLKTIATTSTHRLADVEITSPGALLFFSNPVYRSFFSHLKRFKVDLRGMRDPVDILPSFESLEVLEAYGLRLPTYDDDVDLPIVRTLKRMYLKSASMQWICARTFPALEESTIIHPQWACLPPSPHFPTCTRFTYDDRSIEQISEFRLPKLDKMIIRNEAWSKLGGSLQLASVWGELANSGRLRPRVLHLDVHCYDQDLINALRLHPNLEVLVLGLVRPSALGKKFFNSMVARKVKGTSSIPGPNSASARPNGASSNLWVAPLIPNLRCFGVRYRRWIRETEEDNITPLLKKIIQSREKTEVPLRSVKFWPNKDTPEEDALELVPPRKELVVESRVNAVLMI